MSENGESAYFLTIVFGAAGGVAFVFMALSCVFRWKTSPNAANGDSGDGYQAIRENGRSVFWHPCRRKTRKTSVNGTQNTAPGNSFALSTYSLVPNSRLRNFPAGPLPILPASTNHISANGGMVTRGSSTSELYASVDRNPAAIDASLQRRSSSTGECDGRNETGDHTYSQIRPPPGTYDEIDDGVAVFSKRGSAPVHPFSLSTDDPSDPLYFRVQKPRADISNGPAPPPIPRLPRTCHPYDYPKFLSNGGPQRWRPVDGVSASDQATVDDAQSITASVTADAMYSKIDSQYGGSEDPYSSIKSSEEHYSCVVPNGKVNDDGSGGNAQGLPPPLSHGPPDPPATYGSIRPRSVRFNRQRRSHSFGEEYSVIQKPSSKPCRSGRAPPVPEKRYSALPFANEWTNPPAYSSAGPSNGLVPNVGYGDDDLRPQARNHGGDLGADYQGHLANYDDTAASSGTAKREPNYRFITVRESLEALRARMEASAATAPTTVPTGAVQSDSSVHYYATITENNYEVVSSRRASEGTQQEELDPVVGYIDDDPYESCSLSVPSQSPNSTRLDSDGSSNTLMASAHSNTDNRATSSGSHVTLVHVAGSHSATLERGSDDKSLLRSIYGDPDPKGSPRSPRPERSPRSRHPETSPRSPRPEGSPGSPHPEGGTPGRERPSMSRLASSDDSTTSTGVALSIEIERSIGVDENLSTVDHRDLNPSTTDYMESYSCANGDSSGVGQFNADSGSSAFELLNSGPNESAKSPDIVKLETLENFSVSSNSLNSTEPVQLTSGAASFHV